MESKNPDPSSPPAQPHVYSYNEEQLNANCSCGWRFQDCNDEFGRNQWNVHAQPSPPAHPAPVERPAQGCTPLPSPERCIAAREWLKSLGQQDVVITPIADSGINYALSHLLARYAEAASAALERPAQGDTVYQKLMKVINECENCGFCNGKFLACKEHGFREPQPSTPSASLESIVRHALRCGYLPEMSARDKGFYGKGISEHLIEMQKVFNLIEEIQKWAALTYDTKGDL
jgi:hypothetical protein